MHIRKLSEVLTASGLGLFLITGLTGCDNNQDDKCLEFENIPSKLDECRQSIRSTSSGFFMPLHSSSSSSYHSSGG